MTVKEVAATICGMTMNMLKMPMYTPILFGSKVELNMAYGMESMDPQEKPIQTNDNVNIDGSVMKYILMKPYAPAKRLNM